VVAIIITSDSTALIFIMLVSRTFCNQTA